MSGIIMRFRTFIATIREQILTIVIICADIAVASFLPQMLAVMLHEPLYVHFGYHAMEACERWFDHVSFLVSFAVLAYYLCKFSSETYQQALSVFGRIASVLEQQEHKNAVIFCVPERHRLDNVPLSACSHPKFGLLGAEYRFGKCNQGYPSTTIFITPEFTLDFLREHDLFTSNEDALCKKHTQPARQYILIDAHCIYVLDSLSEFSPEELEDLDADFYKRYGKNLDQAELSEQAEESSILLDSTLQELADAHQLNYHRYVYTSQAEREFWLEELLRGGL